MELHTWLLYAAIATINILSPGPAVLLAISNRIAGDMRLVLISSAGNVAGLFVISSFSFFGLGTLLSTSASLFLAIKVLGACYLIYLGSKKIWASGQAPLSIGVDPSSVSKRYWKRFIESFLVAVTNPKALLFFIALFPQFLDSEASLTRQFLIMTLTFMALSFISLSMYGWIAGSAQRWFRDQTFMKVFDRITGGIFIGLGIGLLQLRAS